MYAIGLNLGTLLNWIHLKNRTGTITMLNRFAGGVSWTCHTSRTGASMQLR